MPQNIPHHPVAAPLRITARGAGSPRPSGRKYPASGAAPPFRITARGAGSLGRFAGAALEVEEDGFVLTLHADVEAEQAVPGGGGDEGVAAFGGDGLQDGVGVVGGGLVGEVDAG